MVLIHVILGVLYLGLALFFILYYRTYKIEDATDKFFFASGFVLKMLGATAAAVIYVFYYGGGDTIEYFKSGELLLEYVSFNVDQLPEILIRKDLKNFDAPSFLQFNGRASYWYAKATHTITKVALVLNALTLNSFYLTSILCSFFSFFCSWKFYRFFIQHSQLNRRKLGYAIFFMPSVVFWGSGLFKDTFTLGGLYLLIIGFVNIFGFNKLKVANFIYLIVGVYLIYSIRSFYLMAALPFLLLWVFNMKFYNISNISLRFLLVPFFFLLGGISIFFTIQFLSRYFQELSFEQLVNTSKGFQNWHSALKGSTYSLGDIEYSTSSLVRKIPAAIVVTFFRPFLWEAGKPIILLSALQSLFFLLITIYAVAKMRVIYFFTSFFSSPQAIALMGFSLFFGVVVGFTSYNFGALDRYKVPCLSTYMIALLYIWETYKLKYPKQYG